MKFQMKKKGCLVYVCLLCVYLCACGGTGLETEPDFQEQEPLSQKAEQGIPQESELPEETKVFLEQYHEVFAQENAKRAALIYLDEDTIPELLILKDGEYRLYSFDGSEIKAVAMSDTEIKASAYGFRHDFEEADHQTFYWFEYVPYKGLIRVHDGTDQERYDYYLRYADGLFLTELEAKSEDYTWHTYNMEQEITNEDFLSQLDGLGYDRLIPCAFLYDNVEAAYENIDATWDTGKVLEDFVNGKINALEYVEEIGDIPEDGFVMRSYEDIYEDITCGEEWWGSTEYIDFDNDGENELILHGYTGSRLFFDVIGDTVYEVLHTGSTTDQAFVTEIDGRKVIARADFLYVGRKSYRIMEYGPCCCLIDWYCLSASYGDKSEYSAEDKFEYRGREITMEEFEERVDGIYGQPQDGEDTRPLTEEEREVLLAYAEYLGKFCEENPDYADMMKFDLLYIDADDIPELAIVCDCSHCSGVCICVYDDKEVAEVGWFGSNGNLLFKPYANLIFSTYQGLGAEWSSFYRIEGAESVEQQAFHSQSGYQGVEYVGFLYEVDGTRVSEEEYTEAYNEAREKWDLEALDEWGYDDALLIKDMDDLYEGMCRRYSEVAAQSRADEALRSSAQEEAAGRCYLNDVPNDILKAAPSYAGRVGYICEYDE